MISYKHQGKIILIIDDDKDLVEFYSSNLVSRGYVVHEAYSGGEGLEILSREKIHLIILDLRMPLMDGLETLERLKIIRPDVEVIMASGQGDIESAVKAMKRGVIDFIQKPVKMEELILTIEKRLDLQQVKSLISLYETSQQIFSNINIRYMLEAVVGNLMSIFHANQCGIFLKNNEGDFSLEVGRNISESSGIFCSEIAQKIHKNKDKYPRTYVFGKNLPDYPELSGIQAKPAFHHGVIVPLAKGDSISGVLYIAKTEPSQPFESAEFQSLVEFSSKISNILQSFDLYGALEQKIDGLKNAQREVSDVKLVLQEKEKFAKLGVMASEMAHEINNPLSAVVGYVDLMLQESHIDLDLKGQLNIVFREAQRCSEMIRELLVYSRKGKSIFEKHSIEDVLREVLEVLAFEMARVNVSVRMDVDKNIPLVQMDPARIKQVFLNLIKNACHALEDKPSDRCVKVRAMALPENQVTIEISDNGPGIPPEVADKIFDPFVTTKAASGKGTGLGLSISKSIVEEHAGQISVLSQKGEGTSFRIILPIEQRIGSSV